jgi:hypothetical protein
VKDSAELHHVAAASRTSKVDSRRFKGLCDIDCHLAQHTAAHSRSASALATANNPRRPLVGCIPTPSTIAPLSAGALIGKTFYTPPFFRGRARGDTNYFMLFQVGALGGRAACIAPTF